MTPIEGKRYIFMIDVLNVGDTYGHVVCLKSNSYQRTANVIDMSSKCGTFKGNGLKDRTITIDGNVINDVVDPQLTEGELNDLFENDTKVAWLFGPDPDDIQSGDSWYTGTNAIISALSLTAPEEGALAFNGTVQINGVPVRHTDQS